MVSSDFGKLEVRRHLSPGMPCAIAGAATSVVAPATAPPLRNVRRFMIGSLPESKLQTYLRGPFAYSYSGVQAVRGRQPRFSKQFRADEQRAHRIRRLHHEHGVAG